MINGNKSNSVDSGGEPASTDTSVATQQSSIECGDESETMTAINADGVDDTAGVLLDERVQAQIGQQLTSFYRELVNQPIPQNFMDLLARLDRQEDGK